MKRCTKCGEVKPFGAFSKNKTARDGMQFWCKACVSRKLRAYYATEHGKEQRRKATKAYLKTEQGHAKHKRNCKKYRNTDNGRAVRRELNSKYYRQDPTPNLAHGAVKYAITTGRLTRQPCEMCGSTEGIEAHHDDYSKPLEVRWLCRKHHVEHHTKLRRESA